MTASETPQFLTVDAGGVTRRIAYLLGRHNRDSKLGGAIWLPGLKSEMTSTKASALAQWADQTGAGLTRFDYSGHGQSSGAFEDGRIGHWLDEADAVFTQLTQGPQVLVGSSTGGYLALLLLRRLMQSRPEQAARIKGLVLIAPAWDLTTTLMWDRFPESAKRAITETGVFLRPSSYGDGPYAITRGFIEEGKQHLIGPKGFDPERPIYVLHGLLDEDVPWEHTLDLVATMHGDHVHVEAVPEGDHRLSQPENIALMLKMVGGVLGL